MTRLTEGTLSRICSVVVANLPVQSLEEREREKERESV